jgi:hypothetical protein
LRAFDFDFAAAIAGAAKQQIKATARIFRIAKPMLDKSKYQNPPGRAGRVLHALESDCPYRERGGHGPLFTAGFVPIKPQFRANDDGAAAPASA